MKLNNQYSFAGIFYKPIIAFATNFEIATKFI